MITDNAVIHLESIQPEAVERYTNYLTSIQPKTNEERFRRWLFTYASVHTSWKMNCRMYQALADLSWLGNPAILRQKIIDSGAGLHNNRSRFISEFAQFYWEHPSWFNKTKHETWQQYRNRIKEAAKGIGQAKAAFLTELIYPMDTRVICCDTHILALYGHQSGKTTFKTMTAIEQHWDESCALWNVPPAIARWLYWDKRAGYEDCRFWSYVFEGSNDGLAQFACA